jgi:hypothetical protein
MVFRRDFIDLAIPADREPSERHADYFLAHLAHMLAGSLIIPQALSVYRLHGQNLHARLPRIGSYQNFGIDPNGAVGYTHERLVLHVLRNWSLFTDLVEVGPLADGLRRYCCWHRLERLAASADIPPATIEAATRALRDARLQDKKGLRRGLLMLGDAISSLLPASWRMF